MQRLSFHKYNGCSGNYGCFNRFGFPGHENDDGVGSCFPLRFRGILSHHGFGKIWCDLSIWINRASTKYPCRKFLMERTKSARSREDLAHQLRQMMAFISTCTLSHLHFPVVRCSGLHSWTHGRDWTSFSFRYSHRSLLSVLNSFMWVYLRSYPLGCAYGNCWNKDGEPTKIFCHFCCLNLCRKTHDKQM